jgi:DNA-binding response OmpR family regulator
VRKLRAILYDDDPFVREALALFFEERGYDVFAFREPAACVVYTEGRSCGRLRPCADVVVTDLLMPRMSGIELLAAQARRGCPLPAENKAVLSGSLDDEAVAAVRRLGCAWFHKPFRFAQLAAWVGECETRVDRSRPLGSLRREPRQPAGGGEHVTLAGGEGEIHAEVVNASPSGMCLRVGRPLAVEQTLLVRSRRPADPARLTVRWTRAHAGGYLAGASSS